MSFKKRSNLFSKLIAIIYFNLFEADATGVLVAYNTALDQQPHDYSEEDNLITFQEIWKFTFLWAFITTFLVHILATIIALATLRKHKYGR